MNITPNNNFRRKWLYKLSTASLARQMKREKKIETTWVRNCNVFIKTKGDEKIKIIRDKSELSQFN